MLTIKKVLNSSVVLVEDPQKKDFILLRKGVGYGRKPGEQIEHHKDDQVFLPVADEKAKYIIEIVDSIPPIFLELSYEIVDHAKVLLNCSFNKSLYFVLMDHIKFSVDRYKQNLVISSRLYWEMKNYYPKEFEAGVYAVGLINDRLGISIPETEAVNIAFHLVNARAGDDEHMDAMKSVKLISDIVNLVRYTMKCNIDTEQLHYFRFITHLQFFSQRLFSGKLLDDSEDFLYMQLKRRYPKSIDCAGKIAKHIKNSYDIEIPQEEEAYLALHISRMLSQLP